MEIISWNVNGLRSAERKGFSRWFASASPDILCLQEIKTFPEQLPESLRNPQGYTSYFNPAGKAGYAGTALYSRAKPLSVKTKLGFKQFDEEGRGIMAEYPSFTLLALYMPHGGRDKSKLSYKLEAYDFIFSLLRKLRDVPVLLIGDLNIAHHEIDLARPTQNTNNIMFTPEERGLLDRMEKMGFTDTFRYFHKEGGCYTWWPYAFNARERNLGWRIDYAFTSQLLLPTLKRAPIFSTVSGSDHCPLGVGL
ncbi:MAG: exodeoxyribonuclease III [bacterium]|nr:exodeoxyribonuclease III [bacterium]